MSATDGAAAQAKRLDLWQRKLLPFMVISITLMAVFFFISSLWQLHEFRTETQSQLDKVTPVESAWRSEPEREFMQWRVLVQLETNVVARRYEQVRTTMLLRAWTRYVGFLTGMILALVGAVFVLGKLGSGEGEAGTEIQAEGGGFQGKVATPYPGVALAFLGTVLMALSILVPFEFKTSDSPAYLAAAPPRKAAPSAEPEAWPAPDAPPEAPKTKAEEPKASPPAPAASPSSSTPPAPEH